DTHQNPLSPNSGNFSWFSGANPATVELEYGTALTPGSPHYGNIPAGSILAVREFSVPTTGYYHVNVQAEPGVKWYVFNPPAAYSGWRTSSLAQGSGEAGGPNPDWPVWILGTDSPFINSP